MKYKNLGKGKTLNDKRKRTSKSYLTDGAFGQTRHRRQIDENVPKDNTVRNN